MSEEKEIKTENVKPEEKKQEFLFSEAEYRKFENRRLEYSNALIGTFDEKGEYRITSEILKEFVSIPKVIREIRENRYYAISSSQKASYNIKFSVVVGDVNDEKKYATLCLLEDVVNPNTGTYSLKSTPIATYRDDNDGYFIIKMKKAFNLKAIDEQVDGGLFDETKYPNFYAAKSKKLKLKGQLDSAGEELDEIYVIEMIKELKKMGPYGEWVIKNLVRQQKMMGDKFPKKGDKNYFKVYAKLLDQAIMNAKGFPITPEQIAILNRIQQIRMDRLKTATTEIVLVPPKMVKKAAKSADKSSGGGGKKGGGKKKGGKDGGGDKPKAKKDEKKKPLKIFIPQKDVPAQKMTDERPVEKPNMDKILENFYDIGEQAQEDKINSVNKNVKQVLAEEKIYDSNEGSSVVDMSTVVNVNIKSKKMDDGRSL